MNIELEDNVLTVSGERKAEHEDRREGFYRVERAFGAFSRSLTLPKGVDPEAVTAASTAACSRCASPSPSSASRARSAIAAGERRAEDARGRRRLSADRRRRGPRARSGGPSAYLRRPWRPRSRSTRATPARAPAPARSRLAPRRGPHARVRAARHEGGRQDARGLRGRRPRLRHGAVEHVPPVPRARARSWSSASAASTASCAGTSR